MGVTTQRIFRAKVAAKLDVLEEDAAELEQDARERHARLTELGVAPRPRWRDLDWDYGIARAVAFAQRAYRPITKRIGWIETALRNPHLAWAGRVTWGWIREGAGYLAIACALLLPFVLAILLLAPPD